MLVELCNSAGREFHKEKVEKNGDFRWVSFRGRGKRIHGLRWAIAWDELGTVHEEKVA